MCTADGPVPGSVAEALRMTRAGLDYLNGQAAVELDPSGSGPVLTSLGEIAAKLTAAHATVLSRFDAGYAHNADGYGTSAAWLAAMARMTPRDAKAAVRQMRLLGKHRCLEEALAEFKAIVAIDPDSPIGYYNMGNVLAELDRDAEAAVALREVIRLNPNHYNARYNLGEMFRLEGKFDESAIQFQEFLRLAPDTPQNRRNINRAKRLVDEFTKEAPSPAVRQ